MKEEQLNDTSIGASGSPYNAWYTCPRDTHKACVLEPYFDDVNGKQILMTSIAFPLEENGKVIGVLGVDISLESLQHLSDSAHRELYDGQGQVSIISPAALLAGHSRDASLLGKPVKDAFPTQGEEIANLLRDGQSHVLEREGQLRVLTPLLPIPQSKPWGVLLEVPKQVLLGPALQLEQQLDEQRLSLIHI